MAHLDDVPNLTPKHLRAVVALARYGSFVAAASSLRISQPGLSRIIQQSEAMLGVKLFARGTRSVAQTEAGRTFIPAAERMLGELQQQAQKARTLDGEMRGQLIIASLMSISHHVLPAALVAFRKKHPKMYVEIKEGLASGVLEDVRSGIADFGIGSAIGLSEGIVADSIVNEPCYVVLPRRHRLSRMDSPTLKDIADEPMISMPSDSGLRRTLDVFAGERGVVLDHSIVINQFGSLFDFVGRGLGISIVPASALPPANDYPIVVKPLRPAITRRIGVLRLSERSPTPASEAFLAIFRPRFLAATKPRRMAG
ncbi:MAG: LysR family transcriptional regulator [Pseudolabrys sp.]|nr:LysR family transcriptional regulator [Pseudolabrys sp.]